MWPKDHPRLSSKLENQAKIDLEKERLIVRHDQNNLSHCLHFTDEKTEVQRGYLTLKNQPVSERVKPDARYPEVSCLPIYGKRIRFACLLFPSYKKIYIQNELKLV